MMRSNGQLENKTYKVFFVEVDDDDRERVIGGQVEHVSIEVSAISDDVFYGHLGARGIPRTEEVILTAKLVPRTDGTYFTIEDFSQGEE